MSAREYHKCPAGSPLMFYRLSDTSLDVIRALHQRMNVAEHL
jgi:plasmid stabilization system protein ParE